MGMKWMRTIRVPLPPPWGEVNVPAGYAVGEAPEEASLPAGSIRLEERAGAVLLALPAPGIHAWHPLFGFRNRESPPAIPPTSPHPVFPAWQCRVCGESVIVEGGYASPLWAEGRRGVWCADHLPEAFAPLRLLYPTFPLLTQIVGQWAEGKPVEGDPIPEPGPWPPASWIESEEVRRAFARNEGCAPPAQAEGTCPSCGASGPVIVQETIDGREVEAPCSHLKRAVEILARGPLVFAWGGKPGWTILPAGLAGPMGYRFASPEPLVMLGEADGIWAGLALDEAEYLALAHPAHLPCETSNEGVLPENLLDFLAGRMRLGREVGGVILFHPMTRRPE